MSLMGLERVVLSYVHVPEDTAGNCGELVNPNCVLMIKLSGDESAINHLQLQKGHISEGGEYGAIFQKEW